MMNKRIISVLVALMLVMTMFTGCNEQVKGPESTSSGENLQKAGLFVNVNGEEESIDEENVYGIISELTSELYTGRLAGTKGNELSAEVISEYFKKLGLENPKGLDNYLQYYDQQVAVFEDEPVLKVLDAAGNEKREFENGIEFSIRSVDTDAKDIDINVPVYVLKDGKQLKDDKANIKGKALIISLAARSTISGRSYLEEAMNAEPALIIAEIDLTSSSRRYAELIVAPMRKYFPGRNQPAVLNIGASILKELTDAAEKSERLSFKCDFSAETKKVPNVIGLLPGSDPALKDEYIIVGAHFDHVGDNMNGTYNPGALDNASGTAVMMEVARLMKNSKNQPKKSILFMAFNGEEYGLLGSQYYASNPIYPLKKTVMINLDMVGSSEKLPLMIISPDGGKADLRNTLLTYAKELGIEADKSIGGGSDHQSFGDVGVQSVLLIHEDFLNGYHSSQDTMEDVDKLRLEQVVKLVMYYIDKNAF